MPSTAQTAGSAASILSLNERRVPSMSSPLIEELRRNEQLDEIGGEPTVIQPAQRRAHLDQRRSLREMVEAAAARRNLILASRRYRQTGLQRAEHRRRPRPLRARPCSASAKERTKRDLKPIKEIAGDYLERIELLRERGDGFIGIPPASPTSTA